MLAVAGADHCPVNYLRLYSFVLIETVWSTAMFSYRRAWDAFEMQFQQLARWPTIYNGAPRRILAVIIPILLMSSDIPSSMTDKVSITDRTCCTILLSGYFKVSLAVWFE